MNLNLTDKEREKLYEDIKNNYVHDHIDFYQMERDLETVLAGRVPYGYADPRLVWYI